MAKNSKALIWFEEIVMLVVVLFGLWGAFKGAYISLFIVAVAAIMMVRQFRILRSMDSDEEEDDDDFDNED